MRVLIVTYFFPPYNTVASLRVGKFARYLIESGNDVRVLTAENQLNLAPSLPLEISRENTIYTKWLHIVQSISSENKGTSITNENNIKHKFFRLIKRLLRQLIFPDIFIGWYPYAVREAPKMFEKWRPDIILGSYGPSSSLLIACYLSKKYRVPWVADFRDLWAGNHYIQASRLREKLNLLCEKAIVRTAIGTVTVSRNLSEVLKNRYPAIPNELVYNGYDTDDLRNLPFVEFDREQINVVYTGYMYGDKHDPSMLFESIQSIGKQSEFTFHFYTKYSEGETVCEKAKKYGLEGKVFNHGLVSHQEALAAQSKADILLLLLSSKYELKDRVKGVIPGKFFEYISNKRKILAIGPQGSEVQELVDSYKLGHYVSDVRDLENPLLFYLEQKKNFGYIQGNDRLVDDFTRQNQTLKLERFLQSCLT